MPNHVTHRMIVTGPDALVKAFQEKHFIEHKGTNRLGDDWTETQFDFNTIIPMPEILRDSESSSLVDDGLAVLGRDDIATLDTMLGYPWVKQKGITDAAELGRHIYESNPGCIDAARAAIKCYEETGHSDWYSWSVANWGTKWGAYSFAVLNTAPGRLEFRFDTAWSTPEPIFEKLAGMYPELAFDVYAFDEGWNFAYIGQGAAGVWGGMDVPTTYKLYEKVYGEPPEHDEEEEEVEADEPSIEYQSRIADPREL